MARASLVLVFILSFIVGFPALSGTIFQDDFEQDKEGDLPSKWVGCQADGEVFKDPLEPGNLVMGIVVQNVDCGVVADMDDLSKYVAEWDWLWQVSAWHSMTIHQEQPGENYHLSRNPDNGAWEMWARTGGDWPGPFVTNVQPTELGKWYRCQLSVDQAHIVLKIKERDDNTVFDQIGPALEMNGEDETFKKGKFGVNENVGSFLDNVVIYVGKIAVEPVGKLTTSWGGVKNYFRR
ncbi:hypothetical protein ACFL6S_07690 [Candidatus Poribacteria bacterium]